MAKAPASISEMAFNNVKSFVDGISIETNFLDQKSKKNAKVTIKFKDANDSVIFKNWNEFVHFKTNFKNLITTYLEGKLTQVVLFRYKKILKKYLDGIYTLSSVPNKNSELSQVRIVFNKDYNNVNWNIKNSKVALSYVKQLDKFTKTVTK